MTYLLILCRYYLKGEKKGESDTFVDGLPGYPDNIRSNGRGGFFVVLFQAWNDEVNKEYSSSIDSCQAFYNAKNA